jgi:hypothetical protein
MVHTYAEVKIIPVIGAAVIKHAGINVHIRLDLRVAPLKASEVTPVKPALVSWSSK